MYYRSLLVFLGVKEAPLSVSYFCQKVKLRNGLNSESKKRRRFRDAFGIPLR